MGTNFTFVGQTNNRAGGGRWWTDDSQGPQGKQTAFGKDQAESKLPPAPAPSAVPAKKPDPEPEDTSPDTAEAMYKHFHADEISIRAKQMAEDAISNARYRQALVDQRRAIDSVAGLRGPNNSPTGQLQGYQSPINQLGGYQSPINQLGGFQSPINQLYNGSTVPISQIGDSVEQHIQIAQGSEGRQHRYALSKRYRANKNKNNGVLTDARSVSIGNHMGNTGMFTVGPCDYSKPFTFKGAHPVSGTFSAGKTGYPGGRGDEDVMTRSANRTYWSSYPGAGGNWGS